MIVAKKLLKVIVSVSLVVGFVIVGRLSSSYVASWTICKDGWRWCAWSGLPGPRFDPAPYKMGMSDIWSGLPSESPHEDAVASLFVVYFLFVAPLLIGIVVLIFRGRWPQPRYVLRATIALALLVGFVLLAKLSSSYLASWTVCEDCHYWCTWMGLTSHSPANGAAADLFRRHLLFGVPVLTAIIIVVLCGKLPRPEIIMGGAVTMALVYGFVMLGMYLTGFVEEDFGPPRPYNSGLVGGLFVAYIIILGPFLLYALASLLWKKQLKG